MGDHTVMIPNLCGVIVGSFCTVVFNAYCTSIPWNYYGAGLFVMLVITHFVVMEDYRTVGSIGVVLGKLL